MYSVDMARKKPAVLAGSSEIWITSLEGEGELLDVLGHDGEGGAGHRIALGLLDERLSAVLGLDGDDLHPALGLALGDLVEAIRGSELVVSNGDDLDASHFFSSIFWALRAPLNLDIYIIR